MMRVHAKTNKVLFTRDSGNGYNVVMVASKTNPDKRYTVDMTNGRCSCPAWIFQKGGDRKPCKHLRELGFREVTTVH